MTVTELAIKRPTLVVVLFAFLGVLGIFGYTQLNYDLMPKMTVPIVIISTVYPGASPYEVETSVSKVIEDAVSGVEKVDNISATSFEGRSIISIEMTPDANIDLTLQDAQRKINEASMRLPKDVLKPVISKIAFDEIPVLRLAVSGNLPSRDFYQFIKDKVQPRLSKIEGVGLVQLLGGQQREIKVNIDAQKLKSYNLSLSQVAATLKMANMDLPTGNIKESAEQYTVRVAGKFVNVDEMRKFVIGRSKTGSDIHVQDVAEVEDGIAEPDNYYRLNGIDAVGLVIQKQSDGNTVEVSKLVRKELADLEKTYKPLNLKFNVAQDASNFIMDSANAVKEDLLLAILLVAIVMLFFLHSLRNSLIVLVAIPTSLISTFFMMYIFGFSLNMMTLLAMSLVIGILVDDSIVVLENIHRHLEMRKNKARAALDGRNEIGFAAVSITLVDVVVFVPLALITGIIGNFLREYALVVVFSTLMSLLVSFTVTPVLASRFTKLQHLSKKSIFGRIGLWFESFFNWITRQYQSTLNWSLRHGGWVFLLSIVIVLSSFILPMAGFIGLEFMPVVDRGELMVNIETDPGNKLEQTNQTVHKIEQILASMPEVEKVMSNVGGSSSGMGLLSVFANNKAELYVTLIDKNKRKLSTGDVGQLIKKKTEDIPGMKLRVDPVGLMGSTGQSPIQILVTGSNYEDVHKAAKVIFDITRSVEGTSDVRYSSEEGKPELRVEIDRDKLASLGLNLADIGANLRVALTGDDDSKFRDPRDQSEYVMRVQLDQFDRSKFETVDNLSFVNNKGQMIQLRQFAHIVQDLGPTRLERYNRITSIQVLSQVYGKTSGAVRTEIENKIKASMSKLPSGTNYEFIGEQKYMAQSMINLMAALFAGILFVYMIMVALYNSYAYPFVVLFSIPVAVVGAFYGLSLMGKSISIYSMLGIIMLIGLVAKNAILLVDRTNQMKQENGMSTFEALMEAGQTRLRPILMTTFSMVFGMTPIALSTASGSEAKSGLAVVLIGGLTSSLMLTLVLVPVVYQKFDKWRSYFTRNKKKVEILETETELMKN